MQRPDTVYCTRTVCLQPLLTKSEFKELQSDVDAGDIGSEKTWRVPCQLVVRAFLVEDQLCSNWDSLPHGAPIKFYAECVRIHCTHICNHIRSHRAIA